jgi:hypothetical protein
MQGKRKEHLMNETAPTLTYQQLVSLARRLPLAERVRLVRDILADPIAEQGEQGEQAPLPAGPEPTRSMLGICADLGVSLSKEQIDDARREAWGPFYK